MNYRIFAPQRIVGQVDLPASKSLSNRALLMGALCTPPVSPAGVAVCDDTSAMLTALQQPTAERVDVGAAGTAMRFLTAFIATQQGRTATIDGTERMRQRPIGVLVNALRKLGAEIEYTASEGFPPLLIHGKRLHGGTIEIDGSVSSQYISALLMIGPATGGLELHLTGRIASRPYIVMTIELMRAWGAQVDHTDDLRAITVAGKPYSAPQGFVVESDWSAASYWLAFQALLPQSRITLRTLQEPSLQGDSRMMQYAGQLGVSANRCGSYLDLRCSGLADTHFEADLSDTPDIAQTIVAMLCAAHIHFDISGLETLRIKETDRIEALRAELLKLGYLLTTTDSTISWHGEMVPADTTRARISTYHDHRMAMSMALLSTRHPGFVITDAQVVTKSYPEFWQHLKAAGFTLIEEE